MSDAFTCPQCSSPYAYPLDALIICPECAHEWSAEASAPAAEPAEEEGLVVRDANGALLANGDSVVLVKSLPVEGAPRPIKIGTKVTNIMLVEGDHNISCKIPEFWAMMLKSEFVRKG